MTRLQHGSEAATKLMPNKNFTKKRMQITTVDQEIEVTKIEVERKMVM